jgi:outer membrane protein assembly factor BamB
MRVRDKQANYCQVAAGRKLLAVGLAFFLSALAVGSGCSSGAVEKGKLNRVQVQESGAPISPEPALAQVQQAVITSPEVSADVPLADDLGARKQGVDWPGFLGPSADSKSPETGIVPWPARGPKLVWKVKTGEGYSAATVCRGRLLLFDRVDDEAICRCLHSETGKELWRFSYPTSYLDKYGYDGGPRCCPVTDGRRVYLHGAEGMLHCLRLSDGKLLWKVDTFAAFAIVQNFFGVSSAPLLDGDRLLVQVGGSPPGSNDADFLAIPSNGTCIVAFDKATGKILYRTGNDLASCAAPQIATLDGKKTGLIIARHGLHGFDPETGKERFRFPFRARLLESVNASNIVVDQDRLFLTECYGSGSVLLKCKGDQLETVWSAPSRRRDSGLSCHWNTPILLQGCLYGCQGRQPNEADLRCIEWETGKVKWRALPEVEGEGLGRGSLTYADNHFYYLSEEGALLLIKARPDKYEPVATWKDRALLSYPCWAAPVLSHGLLYLRGHKSLICLEVIPARS